MKDWREKCIDQAKTFTFFKSAVGNITGGYLDIPWKAIGNLTKDPYSFVLSVNHKKKFTVNEGIYVTQFENNLGPCFGPWSIKVGGNDIMNSEKNCIG